MRSRHSLFLHGEVDCEPREENEKFETHIENETERDEIMEKLLTMLLVAFDSRRNPASRLLSHQASVASRAIADFAQALFSIVNGTVPSAAENSRHHHKKRKHGRSMKHQPARKYAQIKKIKQSACEEEEVCKCNM